MISSSAMVPAEGEQHADALAERFAAAGFEAVRARRIEVELRYDERRPQGPAALTLRVDGAEVGAGRGCGGGERERGIEMNPLRATLRRHQVHRVATRSCSRS